MPYKKNLGRVRGKKGGYYKIKRVEPKDENNPANNEYNFVLEYDDNENEVAGNTEDLSFSVPMLYPEVKSENGELLLTFNFKQKLTNEDIAALQEGINIKGEPGEIRLNTYHIPSGYNSIEEAANSIEGFSKNEHTIYIMEGDINKIYIWDLANEEFDSLDGVDLDNYYTKSQTYKKEEIDQIMEAINYYDELALGLLDINYNDSVETEEESVSNITEEEIRNLLTDYARREDLYIEINGRDIIIHLDEE